MARNSRTVCTGTKVHLKKNDWAGRCTLLVVTCRVGPGLLAFFSSSFPEFFFILFMVLSCLASLVRTPVFHFSLAFGPRLR